MPEVTQISNVSAVTLVPPRWQMKLVSSTDNFRSFLKCVTVKQELYATIRERRQRPGLTPFQPAGLTGSLNNVKTSLLSRPQRSSLIVKNVEGVSLFLLLIIAVGLISNRYYKAKEIHIKTCQGSACFRRTLTPHRISTTYSIQCSGRGSWLSRLLSYEFAN